MESPSPAPPPQISAKSKKLYEALFSRASDSLDRDYEAICKAWCEYADADSVWLWLGHGEGDDRTWHLVGHAKQNGSDIREPKACWHSASGTKSVVEYCAQRKQLELVHDPDTWTKTWCDNVYSVQSKPALQDFGCRSFITIPVIAIEQPYPDEHTHTVGTEVVIGALCLHYRKKFEVFISPEDATVWAVWNINGTQQPVTAPKETLEWMGRFTAQALDRSREAIQRRTLLKLNELAGRWLVESIRHPNDARRGYLEALVKFIESEFKIEAISIFYRKDQRSGKVFLLHTTGICLGTEPEKILPEHRWAELTYEIGEAARTAQCFANGKEMPLNDGIDICNSSTSAPKSFEVRPVGSGPVDTKDWKDPALLLPIPLPASEQPGSDGDLRAQALGVMRFAYHRWKRFGEQNRPFDPVEIQTLMFLTEQIGPVLETMANNIEVDRAVSNQRHELRNSMRVINQLVEQMTHGMASPKTDQKTEVLAFNLWDLKFSAMLARNQVQRLYRDEIEKKPLEIEETLIYGTIIARLCDVLGRYAMKEKRIKLNLDHHSCARLPKLHVDRWYVEQALLNLLLNAVKYGDDGSEIRVWCLDDRDGYSILVKGDKGIGIASEDKERVFERGYRTESAREIAKGAGLGLHITKLIMRRHEGDVRLVSFSSPTTFSLWFPAARRFSAPQP